MSEQVWTEYAAQYGDAPGKPWWMRPANGQFQEVPAGEVLKVYTATLSYLPESPNGKIGRADVCGRDAAGTAIWRLQIVYVEPQRTVHLTFPQGLLVGPGGWVEVFASADGDASPNPTGPGLMWVSFTAAMDSVVSRPRPRLKRKPA
jgi:hypothetical protein